MMYQDLFLTLVLQRGLIIDNCHNSFDVGKLLSRFHVSLKSFTAKKVTKHEYILAQHEVSKAWVSQFRYAFVLTGILCKQMHLSAQNFNNSLILKKTCPYHANINIVFPLNIFELLVCKSKRFLSVKQIKTLQAWPSIGVRFQPEFACIIKIMEFTTPLVAITIQSLRVSLV